MSGCLDHDDVLAWVDNHDQGGVRRSRADQPGTGLVDGQPQIRDGIEIEVLERPDRTHQGPQHGEILQPRSNSELDRTSTAMLAVASAIAVRHVASRQGRPDTTPVQG